MADNRAIGNEHIGETGGSDRPSVDDELRAPRPRARPGAARAGGAAAPQRAAPRARRGVPSSSAADRGAGARGLACSTRRGDRGPTSTGAGRTVRARERPARAEADGAGRSASTRDDRRPEPGDPRRSRAPAATEEGGNGRHSGVQGRAREPHAGQGRAAVSEPMHATAAADDVGRGSSTRSILTTQYAGLERRHRRRLADPQRGRWPAAAAAAEAGWRGGVPGRPRPRDQPDRSIGGDDRPLSQRAGACPAPTKKYRSCSTATSRRSTGCTTGSCATTRRLKGQMVLRLTIEPDGSVSMCVLQSTRHECAGSRRSGRGPRPDDQFRREGRRAGRDDRVPDRLPAGGMKPAPEE